ncbi:MAG: FAD-dependent oxidoreductase [Nitrososphaeria archaeon]
MNQINTHLLIVGGGAAGLAAACKAYEEGLDNVLIVEGSKELGGILLQCIHTGFGLEYFKENLTGPEYMQRFLDKIRKYGIQVMTQTMALKIDSRSRYEHIVTVSSPEKGFFNIDAKAVIMTTGCRERGRDELNIPGDRPAGVMTAGTAQRYMDVYGYLPGKEVVVVGSGDIGLIMARRFSQEGANVKGVYEILPYACGLRRNQSQCLKDFGIPLHLSSTVIQINGKKRVESVIVSKVDEAFNPIPGTEEEVKCDVLILATGLLPDTRFPKLLPEGIGLKIDPGTGGPIVNDLFETNIPNIFAAGNFLLVNDTVDDVTIQGEVAAISAAKALADKSPVDVDWKHAIVGEGIRFVVPQMFSGNKDVCFYMRVTRPAENVFIEVPEVDKRFFNRIVRPPEMIKLVLSEEQLSSGNLTFKIKPSTSFLKAAEPIQIREGRTYKEITCIVCPVGCQTMVEMVGDQVREIKGATCTRGIEFIRQEAVCPVRILFTVVPVENSSSVKVLPVRSDKPVEKNLLNEAYRRLATCRVKAPIQAGDLIVRDFPCQGVNIVACRTVLS